MALIHLVYATQPSVAYMCRRPMPCLSLNFDTLSLHRFSWRCSHRPWVLPYSSSAFYLRTSNSLFKKSTTPALKPFMTSFTPRSAGNRARDDDDDDDGDEEAAPEDATGEDVDTADSATLSTSIGLLKTMFNLPPRCCTGAGERAIARHLIRQRKLNPLRTHLRKSTLAGVVLFF